MLALRGHGAALAHSRGASTEPGVLPAAPAKQQTETVSRWRVPPGFSWNSGIPVCSPGID